MLRSLLICLSAFFLYESTVAQVTVSGVLLDEISSQPLVGVRVHTAYPDESLTDEGGRFTIRHEKADQIILYFYFSGQTSEYKTPMDDRNSIDLGNVLITLRSQLLLDRDLPTVNLDEGDDQSDSNISGLLQSGDDLFAGMTDFTFSPARFKRRGLTSDYTDGYLNNLPMNDLESGSIYWNMWGGLNDVTRQNALIVGAEMAEWGFGGLNTSFNTDLRASSQWKQTKISYAVTNRNYTNRIIGTWSTGMKPSGWAVSLSASRRWAQEGYVDGTYYDAWAYFASIDKKFNDKHTLNFVALGSPYQRGGSSTSIQEMYDLADSPYYNSYWGYQEGKKRSSRVYSAYQPLFMLRHDFHISDKLYLTTALGYQSGKSTVSTLDWLDANDPRPDYYRRLPSYVDDASLSDYMTTLLSEDEDLRQVQWQKLYQVNLNSEFTVEDVNGVEGESMTGALSRYVMEDRINNIQKGSANIVLQYQLNDKSQFSFGVAAIHQDSRIYKELGDLLGGEFYVDWDKFAEQDFPDNDDARQNDLRRPNRIVYEGDQFGYDYYAKIRQQSGWISYTLNASKWELALAAAAKNQTYWRDGQTQNGKFPDNSYGDSEKNNFFLPSGKALIRYKLDGRNYITVSGMISESAPSFRNAYVSPRTRNSVVDGLVSEKLNLAELRYDLRSPNLKLSVAGFYITTKDAIESNSFYHDDLNTFVNVSLTGVDKEYAGVEAALEYKLTPALSMNAAANIGQYIYTSRPNATVTQDNNGSVLLENIVVYAENFYVSGTPQSAYTGGLTYRSKKFWSLFLNVNYFQESWVDFNPLRRTSQAVDPVDYESNQWNAIIDQEKLDPAWTVDLSFYKSWLVDWPKNRTYFTLNIGVVNLLNNQNYVNNAYEQYRFDYATKDVNAFPTKYAYMQGLNFFIQAGMRF